VGNTYLSICFCSPQWRHEGIGDDVETPDVAMTQPEEE
jgi:hypothetical protein